MTLKKDEILAKLPPAKYVVAVSGGVDSVVLLDILTSGDNELVVAHIDHGIRDNGDWESRFVNSLAEDYGVNYASIKLTLGKDASEAKARSARYKFLDKIKNKIRAKFISTAHHQDDLLETMILNVHRGTGRRGLTSLRDRNDLIRPLLNTTKSEIYDYAMLNQLEWLEDSSNLNTKYRRNQLRLKQLPKLKKANKDFEKKLLATHNKLLPLNDKIDDLLDVIQAKLWPDIELDRNEFTKLDGLTRREIIHNKLRSSQVDMKNIGKNDIKQAEQFILSAKPSKLYYPTKQIEFSTSKDKVILKIS